MSIPSQGTVKKFYVYLHLIPEGACPEKRGPDRVFYVGKGTHCRTGRVRAISPRSRTGWWHSAVRKYGGFTAHTVFETGSERDALCKEAELIAAYGRRDLEKGPLVNLTDGGDGKTGYVMPPETKLRLSRWNTGRAMSAGTRDRIRRSNSGKRHTHETREKISRANLGRAVSTVTRKKIADALRGRPLSAGTKEKISAALQNCSEETRARLSLAHTNPAEAVRKKMSAAHTGKKHSEETRKKMADSARRRWGKKRLGAAPTPPALQAA